jgi:hypothetical protein
MKWKNVDKPPRGYHLAVSLKINTKLGGTNHTLASRLNPQMLQSAPKTFQDPPASLSWLFDNPCMLVGMDVSHAEGGSDRDSIAAIVASMDGRACQYAAHISIQTGRVEMINCVEDAMVTLFNSFKARNNGQMPSTIIVYRDGVADGQFEEVLEKELPPMKSALQLMGYLDAVKIAIVICQKGHHTRLVFEDNDAYINPCPGLVVDATGGTNSIVSAKYNEFYLNSHSAIQGTAKPCKYALIYDEIGFKVLNN